MAGPDDPESGAAGAGAGADADPSAPPASGAPVGRADPRAEQPRERDEGEAGQEPLAEEEAEVEGEGEGQQEQEQPGPGAPPAADGAAAAHPEPAAPAAAAAPAPAPAPAAADGAEEAGGESDPEPQLKYERLGCDVKSILAGGAAATTLALSEKVLALGTSAGGIHILDYSGNEVKRFAHHPGPVRHLSFDAEAEHIASCCGGSYVTVANLYTDESVKFTFKRPITVVCLDPRYGSRKTKELVTGDVRGRVKLSSQGWLGRSDHVLHQGEGAVQAVAWAGTTLAWTDAIGARVYASSNHQLLGSMARPKHGRFSDCLSSRLFLAPDESAVYAAWPDAVRVGRIVARAGDGGVVTRHLQVIASFPTDSFCLGAVPHGQGLALLVYPTDADPQSSEGGHSSGGGEEEGGEGEQQQQQQEQQQEEEGGAGAEAEAGPVPPPGGRATGGEEDGGGGEDAKGVAAASHDSAEGGASAPIAVPPLRRRGSRGGGRPPADAVVRSPGTGGLAAAAAALAKRPSPPAPAAALAEGGGAGAGAGAAASPPPAPPPQGSLFSRARQDAAAARVAKATAAPATAFAAAAAAPAPPSPLPAAPPSRRSSAAAPEADAAGEAGAAAARTYRPPGRPLRPELRIVTLTNREVASDALAIKGHEGWLPGDFELVPSYGNEAALSAASAASVTAAPTAAAAADGGAPGAGGAPGGGGAGGAAAALAEAEARAAAAARARRAAGLGEFMYFIVSPKDIVIGRYRDAEDRIGWLLERRRFEDALAAAERERGLPAAVWEAVVQAYLSHLTSNGDWAAAAQLLPRLLRDKVPAWERWVYEFGQARRLALLAPVLPTKRPSLHPQTYELVMAALLVDPSHHGALLELVQSWPNSLYSPAALIDAIAQRMRRPGGETRELWQALAHLYRTQGRPDLSLAILLQLQLPSVFDFILEHGLLSFLGGKAALLLAIDEGRALELLVAHLDDVPPGEVVPGLLEALQACEAEGDDAGRELWRRRLFDYLHRAFHVDPACASEFHELQVTLTADYAPPALLELLTASQWYPLEGALAVCEARGLVDEQVYILSRMGNSREALALIIERRRDVPRAIEFVRRQADGELWSELIEWALRSPETTGQLLDHIGGNVNPLLVVRKIPEGMAIPRLRDRLRAIISDFRTQTSLREGCNAVLRSDCRHLMARLQREARRALGTVYVRVGPGDALGGGGGGGGAGGGGGGWVRYQPGSGRPAAAVAAGEVPDFGGAGGGGGGGVAVGVPCRAAEPQADGGEGAGGGSGGGGGSQAAQRRASKRGSVGRGAAVQLPSLVSNL
ncbi:hypothetical protein Rsub_08377 [Raphidocelis subcapitata]|uniref:Vps41 beta-propeller domain-containing protein n=1 Tax=Raphidocelis subcapitata TaxID=307507 RepID=A0A2V0PE94_9CHLO|nr:hypothetical protein Rsub_08377 [Raphidocelis subcapitata]|eukprot:GBF95415.1 hypothetical protein Rsub_08377 [Raphidocelis subcapitata]